MMPNVRLQHDAKRQAAQVYIVCGMDEVKSV
jgi:hypothetical protein